MKTLTLALSGIALALIAATPSQALPRPVGTELGAAKSNVEQIGWRCGWHRHYSWRLRRCVHN